MRAPDGFSCSRLAYAEIQHAGSPLLLLRRLIPLLVPFLAACDSGPRTLADVDQGRVHLDVEDAEALRGLLAASGLAPRHLGLDGELGGDTPIWAEVDGDGHVWSLGIGAVPGPGSLAPLGDLSRLSRVRIEGARVDDLAGLSGARSLRFLMLRRSGLRSLSGLAGCRELRVLDLSGNALESTSELPDLPELRDLDLGDNAISGVAGLARRERLESLDLSGNALESAAGLEDLPRLERLDLARNRLATLDGLRALPKLRELMVHDNRLVDASALDALPSLELVNLNGNRLERFPRLVSRLPQHLWQDNPGTRRYWEEEQAARERE